MFDIELDKTMVASQFHNVRIVTKDGSEIIAYCDLYESQWDSGEGEPCIGLDYEKGDNLFISVISNR